MLTSETKRRIDACRDILVGKLPLPTDQVELITLAMIYKFMDDLDEDSVKMGGKRSFFTGELAAYRWRALLPQTISGEERMSLFANGIEALGQPEKAAHLPGLFRDIFRNAFLKFRDGRILTLFLNEIDGFAYSHSEELGNAFEYLLQCMGTQGENGQFRTPRHIIDFMVACLDPQPGEKILDPACGTGGFLVSAYRHILASHTSPGSSTPGDTLTFAERQAVYKNLTGYDITDLMVKLSKVNLFLHGFPDPAIHIYDTLSNDARWNEKADLILANPPFMTPKGGVTPHTKFRIPAKKAEVLFTDYIAEHLSADGRAAIIVPNGIVATTQNAYVKLRRFLVEDSLVAVISLPSGVFKPYSGVKTSILILDKKLARQSKDILFLKITADGFDLGDKRNPVEANDLPEAERVVKAWLAGRLEDHAGIGLTWKNAERKSLLEHRACNLQADSLFGDRVVEASDHDEVPLGELCEILDSRRRPITKSDRKAGPIPYYGATGIVDYVEGFLFDEPLVLVGEDGAKWGPNEPSAFAISGKTWVNNHAHVLRPDRTRILDSFLIAILNRLDLMQYVTGVTVPKLNQANLREIPIPLPPLDEQRRIVAEIEGYQKVIDGARQILAGYEIRLDVHRDWESRPLDEFCQFIDYRGRTPEKSEAGLPLITAKNVRWGYISPEPAEFVTEQTYAEFMTRGFPKRGDVLFTTEAPLANVALVDRDDRFALAQRIICLSPSPGTAIGGYLFRALLSAGVQDAIKARATGSTVLGIKASSLKEVEIPLPPLPEQRRIVAELDAEAAEMEVVRGLIPRYEAKIQRVLDRVWGGESKA